MFRFATFRSRILSGGLIIAFLLLTIPLPAAAQTQAQSQDQPQQPAKSYARQGTLQGTVYSEGMRARVQGATVKLRNLNTQREYTSPPTDAKGNYKILMIEEGWYTLGVSTAAGDFNLNYGIYVKAGETAKLSVEMLPGGMLEGKGGSGQGGKKGFFAKPAGVLVIVALAGGVGYGVYALTKTQPEASPIR
jgi:hypothetical protein